MIITIMIIILLMMFCSRRLPDHSSYSYLSTGARFQKLVIVTIIIIIINTIDIITIHIVAIITNMKTEFLLF